MQRVAWWSVSFVILLSSVVSAQTKSTVDLANYRGADREEMLKAGAKKEGKLTWYTSLTAHRDIANVFEAKYPGIKVQVERSGSVMMGAKIESVAKVVRAAWEKKQARGVDRAPVD